MLQDVSLVKNFRDSTAIVGTGRQVVGSTKYMASQKDGTSNDISWSDINKKIKSIIDKKPEYFKNIYSKIRSGEINIVEDFRTAMLDISDFAQGRENPKGDSNIAISLAMEKEAERLSRDVYSL